MKNRSRLTAALVALAAHLCVACGSEARVPLSDTFDSKEAAARAVLDGIAARDGDGLDSLAIDAHEFRQVVWPELPSSRPEMNLPVDFAWGQLHQNSRAQLAYTLAEHGGRRYHLVSVRFRGERTNYASFAVHRETELEVRDGTGQLRTLRLFGAMLERGGTWKIFSYVVD